MGLLGKIWVKLGLDNSEFKTGIKESEKTTKGFQASIGRIGGLIAGAFTISAITNFAKKAISEFSQAERAAAKLQSTLRATGGAVGLSFKDLQDFATELESTTAVDGDIIIDAIAKMTTYKSIQGEVFKEGIRLAQDMAEVWGTDLNSQISAIAKALEDPERGITALRRSGTMFTEEQMANIKRLLAENKKYEAQLLILAEIQSQYGGAAERAAKTASGSWKATGIAWDNLMETIGSGLRQTTALANTLTGTIKGLTNWLNGDIKKGTVGYFLFGNWGRSAYKEKLSQADKDVAEFMKGITSISDAQKKLNEIEATPLEMRGEFSNALAAALKAYIEEDKAKKAVVETNKQIIYTEEEIAERKKKAAEEEKKRIIEQAEATKGTVLNLQKEINLLQEKIGLTTDETQRAALNQELANLEHRLAVMKLTTAELKAYNDLIERAGKRGSKALPSVENNIAPDGGVKVTDKSFMKLPKDAQKDFFGSSAYKKNIEGGKKAVKDMEQMIEEVEALNQRFNDAIVFGISDALQTLVDELIETGKVGVGSVVTALVSPFGDMLIQLGEVALMSAIGIEAIKDSFSSMNPAIAAAAGVALIALGSLVKAGVAQIGKSGGKSSGMGNTSFTGGSYIPQPAVASANGNDVMAVIKGEDIWLINKKVDNRKGR